MHGSSHGTGTVIAALVPAALLLLLCGCNSGSNPALPTTPGRTADHRVTFSHQINLGVEVDNWHWIAVQAWTWYDFGDRFSRIPLPPATLAGVELIPNEGDLGAGLQMDPVLAPDDTVHCQVAFHENSTFSCTTTGIALPAVEPWTDDTLTVGSSMRITVRDMGGFSRLVFRDLDSNIQPPDLIVKAPGTYDYNLSISPGDVHRLMLHAYEEFDTQEPVELDNRSYTSMSTYTLDWRKYIRVGE